MDKTSKFVEVELSTKKNHSNKFVTISISVVLYLTKIETINDLLRSVEESTGLDEIELVIYLIDNSNNDEYEQEVKKYLHSKYDMNIYYVNTKSNNGYGAGNNIVFQLSVIGKYHIVTNPDVTIGHDLICESVKRMENDGDLGMISPLIYYDRDEIFIGCKKNPTFLSMFLRSNIILRKIAFIEKIMMSATYYQYDINKEMTNVEYLSGALMFFRSNIFQQIGGFDERFFLHYEDADITRKALQVSDNLYMPSISIVHTWQGNTHKTLKDWSITVLSGIKYILKWNLLTKTKV